jgi:hypothetical protein
MVGSFRAGQPGAEYETTETTRRAPDMALHRRNVIKLGAALVVALGLALSAPATPGSVRQGRGALARSGDRSRSPRRAAR